ncbi:hypothetical protein L9F63_021576, partial [Diploptera punctata]
EFEVYYRLSNNDPRYLVHLLQEDSVRYLYQERLNNRLKNHGKKRSSVDSSESRIKRSCKAEVDSRPNIFPGTGLTYPDSRGKFKRIRSPPRRGDSIITNLSIYGRNVLMISYLVA